MNLNLDVEHPLQGPVPPHEVEAAVLELSQTQNQVLTYQHTAKRKTPQKEICGCPRFIVYRTLVRSILEFAGERSTYFKQKLIMHIVILSLLLCPELILKHTVVGGGGGQRWKLCRKLGRSFPVGLGTSSRILRGSPMVFVLSRNLTVTYAPPLRKEGSSLAKYLNCSGKRGKMTHRWQADKF